MNIDELVSLMEESHRRWVVIGDLSDGVLAGLDLEGRLFAYKNERVLHRAVPDAILSRSNRNQFQNPGGDALWPGPEGTCLGYEYASGAWRVPPAVTGADWQVTERGANSLVYEAEIDLINSRQLGIPALFRRSVDLDISQPGRMVQRVTETIRYIGAKPIPRGDALLIPWSLSQFDWGTDSFYEFPLADPAAVWDFYTPSAERRPVTGGICRFNAATRDRVQLGIGESVPWVKYNTAGFSVSRSVSGGITGSYADIADADPAESPSARGTKFSVYTDPSGFTEIEACGGGLTELEPGAETSVTIETLFEFDSHFDAAE